MNKILFLLLVVFPQCLVAQSATAPLVGDWRGALVGVVGAVVPYVQARIVVHLLDWIKKTYVWVDKQKGWVKELMVVLLNAAPIFIGSYLGLPNLVGLDQWDYAVAGTVLSSAISFGVKAGAKSKALESKMITPVEN